MAIKIICDKELLLSRLLKSVKYIPKKSIIPILDNFLFHVDKKNNLIITSSNSEVTATISVPVMADESVKFCVPARLLVETVKLFREPNLTISVGAKNKIVLTCGKSKFNISGEDGEVYPKAIHPPCEYELSLSSKEFRDGVEVTERFVDPKHLSPQLTGISITERNREIVFVGTDSNALAKYTIAPKAIKDWTDIVIPHNTAKAIFDCLSDKDVIDIFHNGKNLVAQSSEMTILSSLIDAKYPDTTPFFSVVQKCNLILHVLEIKDSLQRLKLYTAKDNAIITFNVKGANLDIAASDVFNNHSGVESITLKEIASVDIEIKFKADLFLNILESISEIEFIFGYTDFDKIVSINPVPIDNEKINKTFLIMAIK